MTPPYLSNMILAIRVDLHDEQATAYRWTDDTLERHIARALAEYSLANPIYNVDTSTFVAATREIDTSTLDMAGNPNSVYAVEWPYDAANPTVPFPLVPFCIFGNLIQILGPNVPAIGDVARLWYKSTHTLSDYAKTYPPEHDVIIQEGAAAYAALERTVYATERLTLTAQTAADYERWGRAAYKHFRETLALISQRNGQAMNTVQPIDISEI